MERPSTDITAEIREFCSRLGDGEFVFADGFDLQDAMTAIDLGDPRMDRGMLRVKDMSIWNFHAQWMAQNRRYGKRMSDEWMACLMDRLFGLEMLWFEGRRSFQDTLLTCLWVQCPDAGASVHPCLPTYCIAVVQACILARAIVVSSNCIMASEEFYPNLGTYQHSGRILHHAIDKLASVLDATSNKHLRQRLMRIRGWLDLLRFIDQGCPSSVGDLLDLHIEPVDFSATDAELSIFPEMTNVIGVGCVRKGAVPMPFDDALGCFRRVLLDLSRISTLPRPLPFDRLVRQTLDLRLRAGFGPLATSVYRRAMPSFLNAYHGHSVEGVEREVQEAILLTCCHSTTRQRRLLPKLLTRLDALLESDQMVASMDSLRYLRPCLAGHFVALGFCLRLYGSDWEQIEAYTLWTLTAEHRSSDDPLGAQIKQICASSIKAAIKNSKPSQLPIEYHERRFAARWACVLPSLPIKSYAELQSILSVESTLMEASGHPVAQQQYGLLLL